LFYCCINFSDKIYHGSVITKMDTNYLSCEVIDFRIEEPEFSIKF
jgi:hypothetical protein